MISLKTQFIIIISIVTLNLTHIYGQDSLTIDNLTPHSYSFTIDNGTMSGAGANFIIEQSAKSQYTMLGEYHGSKQISKFTEALIPNLDQVGYHTMVLEVGPTAGEFLNQLPNNEKTLENALYKVNNDYHFVEDDEKITTIPFFDTKEDAMFLSAAKSKEWEVIGIDQEYYFSFAMLSDWMFHNLNSEDQAIHKTLFNNCSDTLNQLYKASSSPNNKLFAAIQNSNIINEFLSEMAKFDVNRSIVDNFQASIEIYTLNENKLWYNSSASRIKHMKNNLRKGLASKSFDLTNDKLLIKMGAYHLSKGFSPLALFEVGNTLNELAEFNGNTAINIGFLNRYEQDGDQIVDAMESDNGWAIKRRAFFSLGHKTNWTVIDLRPMRGGTYFHPVQYILNEAEEKLVQRYDILIITPTETLGTPNY